MQFEASPHSLSEESIGQLREPVVRLLRVALHQARDSDAADGSPEKVRALLREVCSTARVHEVRAETLILVLKSAWRHLPEVFGMTRLDAERTLAGVITLCIEEYYAPTSASTRRGVAVRPASARDDHHFT